MSYNDFLDDTLSPTGNPPGGNPPGANPPGGVYTVEQITAEIKDLLEGTYRGVTVEGEISNFKPSHSGHIYFSMKDDNAVLSCVMWRSTAQRHRGENFADGQRVLAEGRITVYPPRGQYQLVVDRMRASGMGALQERFEQLKRQLFSEGLFDEDHKIPIPRLPRSVALITSPTGAAIRDFMNVIDDRYPGVRIIIHPVRVQGREAIGEIAAALALANQRREADVIVLTRGGGSLEDLWAFNEEAVARAVFASELPVISAVGHEVDFSISDLVADLRAPTPTAAAMVISQHRGEICDRLDHMRQRLENVFETRLELERERVDRQHEALLRHSPIQQVEDYRRRLDDLLTLAAVRANNRLATERTNLNNLAGNLPRHVLHQAERLRSRVENLSGRLSALAPEAPLRRGYAVVTKRDSRQVITSAEQVRAGEELHVRVADGGFDATAK